MSNYFERVDEELYHHGIVGQKWGIRRYQNPDGSLTNAGRKRYIDSDTGELTKYGKKAAKKNSHINEESANAKESHRLKAVDEGNLKYILANKKNYSIQEIQDAMNRFDKEALLSQKVSSMQKDSLEKGLNVINKMTRVMNTSANFLDSGKKLYTSIDGISTLFDNNKSKEEYTLSRKEMDRIVKNPYGVKKSDLDKATNMSAQINKLYTQYGMTYKDDGSYKQAQKYIEKQAKKQAKAAQKAK